MAISLWHGRSCWFGLCGTLTVRSLDHWSGGDSDNNEINSLATELQAFTAINPFYERVQQFYWAQVWSWLTAKVLLETSCPGSENLQLVVLCLCIQSHHSYCSCSGWFNSRAVTMWSSSTGLLLIREVLLKILWSPVHCSPARCCNRMHAVTLSQMYIS